MTCILQENDEMCLGVWCVWKTIQCIQSGVYLDRYAW